MIRIAAVGDVHVGEESRGRLRPQFEHLAGTADALLIAGDLTRCGDPAEAKVLADEVRDIGIPVVAVLGNHDYHASRAKEVVAVLRDAGVTVLEGSSTVVEADGCRVGIAGTKGFGGGFAGASGSAFGEPEMKAFIEHTKALAERLHDSLASLDTDYRVALLHYAPIPETLQGEPREIWTFLGSDRLAAPILEHRPDLVLHGHAHAGTLQADLDGVPVYNVSVPVMGQDFWIFELSGAAQAATAIH